ncbi:MAG: acyl carrier protein [bacterium]|jgi:acyl carrier protein|nr:acyl carrier protein [bacterium]
MDYINDVRNFVVENFLFGEGEKLKHDNSFLENGIVDSTGILELVSFLEENYRISIADDELIPENLDSLKNIDSFLKRKLNGTTIQ